MSRGALWVRGPSAGVPSRAGSGPGSENGSSVNPRDPANVSYRHIVDVDIGRAAAALGAVLSDFNYRNLDEAPAVKGRNTTTEVLARVVFDGIVAAIRRGELGPSAREVESLRVTLHESHVAWAAFDAKVPGAS